MPIPSCERVCPELSCLKATNKWGMKEAPIPIPVSHTFISTSPFFVVVDTVMDPGGWVRLKVTDSGGGIKPEIIKRIFEPFFTTKPVGAGTGLGLAQVYGILKQHKGFIDVSSEVDRGSTFTMYLPTFVGNHDVGSTEQTDQLVRGDGETILIVEDNEILRTALAESMLMLNYKVREAGDGVEALGILEHYCRGSETTDKDDSADSSTDAISLVLSDLIMPEMGGRELFDSMRQRGIAIPFVVLSGNPLEDALEEMLARGVAGWMLKPPDPEQLSQLVARALGKGLETEK